MSRVTTQRLASPPQLAADELAGITEVRATDPGRVDQLWQARRRRPLLGADGRLLLVAADHPARGSLRVGANPTAMASRADLLARLVESLRCPGVDGVLGTPDVLEDLLLLGALDGKVAVGSMNRGGLQGSVFELDDRFTAYRARDLAERGIEGGKMLTRIGLDDAGTAATLEASGAAVTELAAHGLMAMVEPFVSDTTSGGRRPGKSDGGDDPADAPPRW